MRHPVKYFTIGALGRRIWHSMDRTERVVCINALLAIISLAIVITGLLATRQTIYKPLAGWSVAFQINLAWVFAACILIVGCAFRCPDSLRDYHKNRMPL